MFAVPAKIASPCGFELPVVALVNTGLGSGLMANSSHLLGVQLADVLLLENFLDAQASLL